MTAQVSEPRKDHGINAVLDQALQSYERLPMLQVIFNKLASSLSIAFRGFAADDVEVEIASFSSQRFFNFTKCLNFSSAIALTKISRWDNRHGLVICSRGLVMNFLDVILGGKARSAAPARNRAYTTLEHKIIKQIVNLVLGELTASFKPLCSAEFVFERMENSTNAGKLYRSAEAVISLQLRVSINKKPEELIIMIPYSTLEPIKHKLQQISIGDKIGPDQDWQSILHDCVRDISLPLEVKISDTSKKWSDIVNLQVGSTIALEHEEHQHVDVMCENLLVFKGQLGKMRNKVAVNVSEICLKK